MYKWIIAVLALAFAGCCKTTVVNNGLLPDSALQLVPYQTGETYRFRHSNGLVINFTTIRETFNEIEFLRPCNEMHYQTNLTKLTPDYPIFSFSLSISNLPAPQIYCFASIGNDGFYIPMDNSSNGYFEIKDSLLIETKFYYDVFILPNTNYYAPGNAGIYPDTLYYNYDYGILRIVMSNGEYYEIVP